MAASSSETGVQLIARLGKKVSLKGKLDPVLFPDGPEHKNIIELYGEEGTGKTQMLIHILSRCILPAEWRGIQISGLGISVIFVDTDFSLSLIRVAMLLESSITKSIKDHDGDTVALPSGDDVEQLVRNCLQKLFIVKCRSSSQIFITLDYMENLLSNKPDIGVLMIDSISAFYWIDKCAGGDSAQAQEQNMNRIAGALEKLVNTYNLVVFATKNVMFQKRGMALVELGEGSPSTHQMSRQRLPHQIEHCEYLPKTWSKLISHRLMFCKSMPTSFKQDRAIQQNFSIWFDIGGDKRRKSFIINEYGVTFQM